MKFSAALAFAGLASAKAVQNKYPREVPVPAPVEHPVAAPPVEHPVAPPVEHPVVPPVEHPAATPIAELPKELPVAEMPPPEGHVVQQPPAHLPPGMASGEHIIIIWMNPGGGGETTTVNQQITVTETVVVPGQTPPAVAHPPPAAPVHPPPEQAPPVHPPVEGTPTHPDQAAPVAPGVAATHSVTVGGEAGLIFAPDQIHAQVGDMVIFTFFNANHTATQSTFDQPCQPLAGGMDSGFIPNPDNSIDPPPQVAMQVMVPDALWFYCAQGPHCGKGMVFSINPTAERTHAMFQSMAIQQNGSGDAAPITGGEPPAQAPPAEGVPVATESLPPLPGATEAVPVPGAPPVVGGGNGVVEGIGEIQNGACICSVQCDMGAFPNLEQQGVGAIGGIGGSLPMGQPVRKRW